MRQGLPNRPAGSSKAATFQQWVHDSIRSNSTINAGVGIRVRQGTSGSIVEVDPSADVFFGGGKVTGYVITDATPDDYWVCRTFDADGLCGTSDVYVVKPFHLRRSEFDELTQVVDVQLWSIGGIWNPDTMLWEDGIYYETRTYEYEYKSSSLRVKTWTETNGTPLATTVPEYQVVIPRIVEAVIGTADTQAEDYVEEFANRPINFCFTKIYAVKCSALSVVGPDDNRLSNIALNDGWAWARIATV